MSRLGPIGGPGLRVLFVGIGVLNIVSRPTRAAAELTVAELRVGAVVLERECVPGRRVS
jgi:hypothetical protein